MHDSQTVLKSEISSSTLLKAYQLMHTARCMSDLYEEQKHICSKYVHATSRGHEAIQIAMGMQLSNFDYASPYYRDDALLIGMGFSPYELMLQLMAKAKDPFSGGRSYYAHPASNRPDRPIIPNQSSATGMQAIPATGLAQGIKYLENQQLLETPISPIVVCSLGDACIAEGEVSEAFQVAAFKELPIIYLVQDNDWGISVMAEETRNMDAYEFALGFKGMRRYTVDGSDFVESYEVISDIIRYVRKERKPVLLHAKVPLLGHHTSGVRKEWYRHDDDLIKHQQHDPLPRFIYYLLENDISASQLQSLADEAEHNVEQAFKKARKARKPSPNTLHDHVFAPSSVTQERGERTPEGNEPILMVDAALFAMDEILEQYPEAVFYGQDVGRRLGGVFREAATLGDKHGDERVFNTAIQEAYLVGSTVGMSIVGAKPIVEIQFSDYIWPGMMQLVSELAKSCYLSMGKFPIQSLIRVPIGAYGCGGPYHSGSIESILLSVRGIKVVYPSNAADMKGLMKAAFLDPNPVIFLEHKGLYWAKVPGSESSKSIEPSKDYVVPLGKGRVVQKVSRNKAREEDTIALITYGMGVHWAQNACKKLNVTDCVEIFDLRTLNPLDEEAIYKLVRKHHKVMVLTEDMTRNSFAQSVAGRIAQHCFESLDAPVQVVGSVSVPAIPLNADLEKAVLPNVDKVAAAILDLLKY